MEGNMGMGISVSIARSIFGERSIVIIAGAF
jgi:hypothetical protein